MSNMSRSQPFSHVLLIGILASLFCWFAVPTRADISQFVGDYSGSAEIVNDDGSASPRDMSVSISTTAKGFVVKWTTVTHRSEGRTKENTYEISFLPSDREGVYAAAMKKNVFGHEVQLDPMKGEPYVWARVIGDTLTVYSLFVDADGGYELQQFDRTLTEGGLNLEFSRISNGTQRRTTKAFLDRK
ncbi:hypothetical protein QO034_13790 [Sedimentitalea sp. JM2-8]|uniref:Lipocalin-like domain-containing protein n=1 Tax=Sedimentitalea xiamensis TaxID=3050037 RepID=A0ABT7FGI0_9RHOB|nr:hypothetical protein [Sedimentitalea xiamensis]MDK3074187.1 hypothetical protein [Sedimentitalea xiamensis]